MNKFEKKANELNKEEEKSVVKKIAKSKSSDGLKDLTISVKVNSTTYEQFKAINKVLGTSNNSCINTLISRYVLDNKNVIE